MSAFIARSGFGFVSASTTKLGALAGEADGVISMPAVRRRADSSLESTPPSTPSFIKLPSSKGCDLDTRENGSAENSIRVAVTESFDRAPRKGNVIGPPVGDPLLLGLS